MAKRLAAAVLGLLVVLAGTAEAVLLAVRNVPEEWKAVHGCAEMYPGRHLYPSGVVRSCRLLRWSVPLFGDPAVDFSASVLLDTDRGAFVVRVDYHEHDSRFWSATATELAAAEAPPELSVQERQQVRDGIAARGGALLEPWTLVYNDG
jgi:hypothetical protein